MNKCAIIIITQEMWFQGEIWYLLLSAYLNDF